MHDEKYLNWFDRHGLKRPEHAEHGTEEDIAKNMKQLKPNSWRMDGNRLIGETEMGPLTQFIPTNYILIGTDNEGMPTFKKIA